MSEYELDEEALPAGTIVGEYEVERVLGEGGFGTVYAAVHPLIGKRVAVKVLNAHFSANAQIVSRFVAEARAVNQIQDEGIIDIFSFGSLEDGRQFYVMEFLDGEALDERLSRLGSLNLDDGVAVLEAVARSLEAAHKAGIAHRDLKPENIYLQRHPDGTISPRLLDFGIAKLMGKDQGQHATQTGTPMGTPLYMSPEQCRGVNVDHRADIYSLGVVAFKLFTGRDLYVRESVPHLMTAHMSDQPPTPSSVLPTLPQAIDEPILAMLEKKADDRPQSPMAAISAIRDALQLETPNSGPRPRLSMSESPGSTPRGSSGQPSHTVTADIVTADTAFATGAGLSRSETPTPSGRAKPLWIGGAIAAAAIAGFFLTQRPWSEAKHTGDPESDETAQVAAIQAPAFPPVAPEPPNAPPREEATPKAVELKWRIDPPGVTAVVKLGDQELGATDEIVKIPYADTEVELTVSAPGYKTETLRVTPKANAELAIKLTRLQKPKPKAVLARPKSESSGGLVF